MTDAVIAADIANLIREPPLRLSIAEPVGSDTYTA